MITIRSAKPMLPRSALAIGAAVLFCTAGLAACSNAASPTSTPAQASQPAAGSHTSAPAGAAAPGAPGTASGSACGLVTPDEVATATGKPMGAGNGAGPICSFSATSDPSVVVYFQVYGNAESTSVARQIVSSGQHVTGLGDDAFWTVAGTLFVQKGDRGFTITMPSLTLTSQTAPPKIVALATAALARF